MRQVGGPVALLLLGASLPLLRVLPDPAGTLPGLPRGDVFKHAWSFWHARVAPGWWTDRLNAPDGGLLLDVMAVPAHLLAPLTALAGPVVACKLWLWQSFGAVGLATALLAWELTGARWPSAVAGLVAQTSPFLLGYPLESGVHERLAVWVFPLVLWSLLAVGRRGSRRAAAVGTAGLLLATLGCQVYGPFAVVMGICALPLWVGAAERRHLGRLLLTVAAMGAVLAAAWWVVRAAALDPRSLSLQPDRVGLTLGPGSMPREAARLALLLDPRAAAAQEPVTRGDVLSRVVYLGWAPLLLALGGALVARPRRLVATVVAVGVLMALLACGPRFELGGRPYLDPLWTALAWVVPTYGGIPPAWQQVAAAGPLLAVGAAALLARLGPVAWALGLGVVLLERALVLPVPLVARATSAVPSSVYGAIAEQGAVVELPRAWQGGDSAHPGLFLGQTVHGQPLMVAINVGSTAADRYPPVVDGRADDWAGALACLRRGGVRWVVVHGEAFASEEAAGAALRGIAAVAGPAVARDAAVHLFDLGEPGPARGGGALVFGGAPGWWRDHPGGCPFDGRTGGGG